MFGLDGSICDLGIKKLIHFKVGLDQKFLGSVTKKAYCVGGVPIDNNLIWSIDS